MASLVGAMMGLFLSVALTACGLSDLTVVLAICLISAIGYVVACTILTSPLFRRRKIK